MKRNILLALISLSLFSHMAMADVPMKINYQGRATDASGIPVADGTYGVIFRIYNVENSGSPIWSESQTVSTRSGYFNTALGSNIALTPACFAGPAWLEVMWSGDSVPMAPRHQLNSVPYAIAAATANTASALVDNAIKTSMIADGQVTGAKIASGTITGGSGGNIASTTIASANIADGAIDTQAKAPWAPKVSLLGNWASNPVIICGYSATAAITGIGTVPFNYTFSQRPRVFCIAERAEKLTLTVTDVTTTEFVAHSWSDAGATGGVGFSWMAIGN